MPRKQVSRRRRGRKSVEYDFAEAPAGDASSAAASEDSEEGDAVRAPGAQFVRAVGPDGRTERHVSRDYSHVRNEVLRIGIIGGGLIIVIVIAGFFR